MAEGESEEDFLRRIKPDLDQLEVLREIKLGASQSRQKMLVPIGIVAVLVTLPLDYWITHHVFKSPFPLFPIATLFAAIGIFIWWSGPERAYKSTWKDTVMPAIVKIVGLSVYDPNGFIDPKEMGASKILPMHSRVFFEDYFEGTYKGARIRFVEAKFERHAQQTGVRMKVDDADLGRISRQNQTMQVTFDGLVLMIDLPNPAFSGHTILVKNRGKAGGWLTEKLLGMKRVPLSAMDNVYDAFSSDESDAIKILDTRMMERVSKIERAYQSTGVTFAFYGNHIFMMIATDRNMFEPGGLSTPATDLDSVRAIRNELQQVFGLVADLESYGR